MKRALPRRYTFALAALAFGLVLGHPRTSAPSSLASLPPANPAEETFLRELQAWLSAPPQATAHFRLFATRATPMPEGAPRNFALFQRLAANEAGRRTIAALPYGEWINESAERYQLDALLLAAVVEAESNFNPRVVSPRGAVGLTQVMPSHSLVWSAEDLKNPRRNLDFGARYLRQLMDQFQGELPLALAAYNAGPAVVERYHGVPPYSETRQFVERVISLYRAHHQELWHDQQKAG